jgi:hypothetical protein
MLIIFGEIIVGGAGFMHIWRDKKERIVSNGISSKAKVLRPCNNKYIQFFI